MTKTHIRDRLLNWGRYWRDHNGQFNGHCRSIEHRYVRGKDEAGLLEAEAQQARVTVPPDVLDAELVNSAWKQCTQSTKKLLKWSFCFGPVESDAARAKVCNRCGIRADPASVLEIAIYKAVKEIERVLDTSSFLENDPRNSSSSAALRPPVHSATERPRRGLLTPNEVDEID